MRVRSARGNRARRAVVLAALAIVAIAPVPRSARAQSIDRTIDVSHFRVAPASSFHVTDGAVPLPHLEWAATAWIDLAAAGVLVAVDPDTGSTVSRPVLHRLGFQIAGALGLFDRAEIGVNVLAVPFQTGDPLETGTESLALRKLAFGDVRFRAKVAPYPLKRGLTVAAAGELSLPTGHDDAFVGDRAASFTPALLLELRIGRVRAGLNGGWTIRRATRIGDLRVDDELRLSAAVRVDLVPSRIALLADAALKVGLAARAPGVTDPAAGGLGPEEIPVEGTVAVRFMAGPWMLTAGAGLGIGTGYGAPRLRFFVGGGHGADSADDPDADGLAGETDRCPRDAEDADGFQDADGCPDLDDDTDGLPDRRDKCKDQPEDKDGFEDEDGCPDADNDGDGIADLVDDCPREAEDMDGWKDADGCADPDDDTDGIADAADRCPREAEDKDGFEDVEGCPDLDNDADGLADLADRCPFVPEDKDGFEDADGCIDPDNDADGFVDTADKCPSKPETWNGVDDGDGCPDKGKVLLVVKAEKIEIKDRVFFDFNKATIQKKSFKLLDSIAAALTAHAEITKVRIEGHTDEVGTREVNLKLSDDRARAVMAYFVARGIDPSRLEAVGYGFDRPLVPGKAKKAADLNRRVEFVIVERAVEGGG